MAADALESEERTPGWAWVWAYSFLSLVLALQLNLWYWPGAIFHNDTAGIWSALAWDWANGEFYRPLLSEQGYGGTRYMPLYFGLHALLLRAGLEIQLAGCLLLQASVLLCALVLVAFLRSVQTPWRLALPLGGAVYGTILYQDASIAMRCDYLAAALVLAALLLWRQLLPCVGLLTLAFLCKMTSLYALAVLLIWYRWQRRSARALMALTALAVALSLGLIGWLSQGRFWSNFWAAADGGGISLAFVLALPGRLLRNFAFDPFMFVLLLLATYCCWKCRQRCLARLYFVGAWTVTVAIFLSPGSDHNHCIELHLASLAMIGSAGSGGWLFGLLTLAWAVTAVLGKPSTRYSVERFGKPTRQTVEQIHRDYLAQGQKYWASNPMVSLLRDQKPLVLDGFNLQHMIRRQTEVGRDFLQRVERREFDVVVLSRKYILIPRDLGPDDAALAEWEEAIWDTQGSLKCLRGPYKIHEVRRPFVILLPHRPGSGDHGQKRFEE